MPALEEAKTVVLHHPSQQRISFQTTVGHENSKGWTGLRTSMQSSSLVFGYQNDVKQKKKGQNNTTLKQNQMTKPRKQKDAVLQFLQKRPFIVEEALYPPANKTTAMYSTTLMLQASSFNFP